MRRKTEFLSRVLVSLVVMTLLMALGACTTYKPATPTPASTPGPATKITSPAGGAVLAAGDIKVSVEVSNFNLVDKKGQTSVPGEGHIHYFIDVDAPTEPGKPAVTAAGTYAASSATSYTWPNVTPGTHTLSVELINNDHTPLSKPVVAKITVTVQAGTPPLSPTPTATASPSPTPTALQSVTINISSQNLSFDKSTMTVPAGASVTIVYNNKEGIPHNVAVYETSAAAKVIFRGEIITGPKTVNYQFTAPATPGTYFFRCDVHPTAMTGSFIVQ